jgi:monoamine oxidase
MARTPLMRTLRKFFLDYCTARAQGVSLAALEQLRRDGSPAAAPISTRRDFLRYSGAAAAALALPKRGFAAAQPRVAIVGAGIAGLGCALTLADRGIASTIYEASHRVGGRMFSNRTGYWADAQVSEWGGELIDTGHKTMRRLARRFGLPLDNLLDAQAPGAQDTYHFFGRYYSQAQANRDFSALFNALQADLEAAPFPTAFDSFTPAGQVLDHMSVYQWIESRVPGGHASPLGQLLDKAYAIEYAADTTDQSALNILYLLAFQPDPTGRTLAVFGESDEAFHIRGGNDQLPRAIARHLGVTETIRFGKRLVSLRRRGGAGHTLVFEGGGASEEVRADIVVLALPFAVLRDLDIAHAGFDARKITAICELGRGVSAKLQLQFDQRSWAGPGPWPGVASGGSYADTGYQASWEVTRAQAGQSGILTFFSAGSVAAGAVSERAFATAHNALVVADARRALNQVQPVYPGLPGSWNGRATQSLWHKHPNARLAYAYYKVGQYTRFGGYEKARQGSVFFCGEHTSTDFQGFMEGGASEGVRAGREVARTIQGR